MKYTTTPLILGASAALAGALFVAPATAHASHGKCYDVTSETLLPSDTQVAASINLKDFRATPQWQQTVGAVTNDPEIKQVMKSMSACGVPFESIEQLWLGFTSTDVKERAMIGIRAPNVGKKEAATCLATLINNGKAPKGERDGYCAIVREIDEGSFVSINENHVVLVTENWKRGLLARTRGGHASHLGVKLTGMKGASHVSFAAEFTPEIKREVGPDLGVIDSFIGAITGGKILKGEFHAHTADASTASKLHSLIDNYINIARAAAPAMGASDKFLDRVKVSEKGPEVHLNAEIDYEQLVRLMMSAGGGGGSEPEPAKPETDTAPSSAKL